MAGDGDGTRSTLARRARSGALIRVYPGIYIEAGAQNEPAVRIAAASSIAPDAVITGAAALFLAAGWSDHATLTVDVFSRTARARTSHVRVHRRSISPAWVADFQGVRVCRPAYAVADLAGTDDGKAIDRFLREGGRLADVEAAGATMVRWPNAARRRAVIKASRTLPWSGAERLLHRILLDAGITGWIANLRVVIGGRTYFLDVGFARLRLALEADGLEFHGSRGAFVADRERQNQLVLAGWKVLRFSWEQLQDAAQVAAEVRAAICDSSRQHAA